MLMRGDLNKIFEQINPVLESMGARIKTLEEKVAELEAPKEPKVPKSKK